MSELQDTIIIEFNSSGSTVDHVAVASFDDELNDGATSFGPGDTIYLWLHLSNNVRLDGVEVTDGSVLYIGSDSRDVTDQIFFTSIDTTDPSTYTSGVIPSATSEEYFGNVGSPVKSYDEFGLLTLTGSDVSNIPYIGEITNAFSVLLFKVTTPDLELEDDESYPLGIVFYISEI